MAPRRSPADSSPADEATSAGPAAAPSVVAASGVPAEDAAVEGLTAAAGAGQPPATAGQALATGGRLPEDAPSASCSLGVEASQGAQPQGATPGQVTQFFDLTAADEDEADPGPSGASVAEGRQDDEDDHIWFLPTDEWEIWWHEEDGCPYFYDAWDGHKLSSISGTSAFKAKGRSVDDINFEVIKVDMRNPRPACQGVLDGITTTQALPEAVQEEALIPAEDAGGAESDRKKPAVADPARELRGLQHCTGPTSLSFPTPSEPKADEPTPKRGTGVYYTVKVTEANHKTGATRKTPPSFRATLQGDCSPRVVAAGEIELFEWEVSYKYRRAWWVDKQEYIWLGRTNDCVLQPRRSDARLPVDPVVLAVVENNAVLLRDLLDAGENPRGSGRSDQKTPLLYAAEAGSANCCVLLLHRGARDPDAKHKARSEKLQALLKALDGDDDNTVDFKLLNEQTDELSDECNGLVDEMMDAVAERKRQERAVQAEIKAKAKHTKGAGPMFSRMLQKSKEPPPEAEETRQRAFREEHRKLVEQLEKEDEEERIHRQLEEEALKRQRETMLREQEAQAEAEERREQMEAEQAEAERQRVEQLKRQKDEAETAQCIRRLQEAARQFDLMQQSKEQKEAQKREIQQRRFRERMQAEKKARAEEEQEEKRLQYERECRQRQREQRALERQRKIEEEEAKEVKRLEQVAELESLFCAQKAAAWTCSECGELSVDHPDTPGRCMFCDTPRDQGHIAQTWAGWAWGPGGVMVKLE